MIKHITNMLIVFFTILITMIIVSCNEDNQPSINNNDIETVRIDNHVWMQKNLEVDRYRNGDPIPKVTDPEEWANLTAGAWCYYDNDSANGEIYGKLYNWYAVNDPRGLAPEGWHVTGDQEWKELEDYLRANEEYWCDDNSSYIAKSLASEDLWQSSTNNCAIGNNLSANNKTGFTGMPGGYRLYYTGNFHYIGEYGLWWSSTEYSSAIAISRGLHYISSSLYKGKVSKRSGFSVRCVRD